MYWKRTGLARTVAQWCAPVAAHAVALATLMVMLPGCAFLLFADQQDSGAFKIAEQPDEARAETATDFQEDARVQITQATWWGSEVQLRFNVKNASPQPLSFTPADMRLTLLDVSNTRPPQTPAFYAPGDDALLAGIACRPGKGPWQRFRPFGDVQAARNAAAAKKPLPVGMAETTFTVPPATTASFDLEFEAPRMLHGEFTVVARPQNDSHNLTFRFSLAR